MSRWDTGRGGKRCLNSIGKRSGDRSTGRKGEGVLIVASKRGNIPPKLPRKENIGTPIPQFRREKKRELKKGTLCEGARRRKEIPLRRGARREEF